MPNITSLSELLDAVKKLKQNGDVLVYRGQGDSQWGLVPGVYRFVDQLDPAFDEVNDPHWISEVERDLYRTFHDRGMRLVTKGTHHSHTRWSSLFLAQHHGLPARLLDWSRDCLTAAYFACVSEQSAEAAIHVMNVSAIPHPNDLGRLSGEGGFRMEALTTAVVTSELSFFDPQSRTLGSAGSKALPNSQLDGLGLYGFLTVIDPPSVTDRLTRQSGVFSVYLSKEDDEIVCDHKPLLDELETRTGNQILTTFTVPEDSKVDIVDELKTAGKDPFSVFPDIQGLIQLATGKFWDGLSYYKDERKTW